MKYRHFLLLIIFFSFPVLADQLIIEPDMGRSPILNTIQQTKHQLNLVMYGFTDEALRNAIIKQKLIGRTVQIILEGRPYKAEDENKNTQNAFNENHVDWHGSVPPFRLIHQKTLIVDHDKALVMTFNFTHSAFKNERNFGLLMDDPQEVREIQATFNADWNHVTITHTNPNLVWSPDNSRAKIVDLIQSAHQHIQVYSQNISDYKMVGALAAASRKGISVTILTSAKIKNTQANYLKKAGVILHHSNRYIHAKVIIIDDSRALLGSINFTRASLDDNRELSVITDDKAIVKQLRQTFNEDV